jgi:SNF2 family DNA or RNA helicase
MNYGTVKHGDHKGRPAWFLEPVPHVAARIKRIFPRVNHYKRGTIVVADTPDIAADLEWILSRWPMIMAADTADHLAARAAAFRESRDVVHSILDGYIPPNEWRDTAIPLRHYQEEAAAIIDTTGRLLLTDDLGLGKSASSLAVLRNPDNLPAAVVCLTHLPTQWAREVRKFTPWLVPHIIPTGDVYDPIGDRDVLFGSSADVLIIPYSRLVKWSSYLAGRIRYVIFDEIQELRHNRSQKYDAAAAVAQLADRRVGLTATPVYNYGDEIHHIMDIIEPDALGTEEEFKREWCRDGYGKPIVDDPAALGTYLRDIGLMLRRERVDVGRELPEVVRIEHAIDIDGHELDRLTGDAVDVARLIMSSTGTNLERMQAAGDFDWRMRHATGVAKATFVADFVRMLIEGGEPVVLFGWHRDVYGLWLERLADLAPAMYTGSESGARKVENAQAFLDGHTDLLIMSLRAGAGLDGLQERARVCVFGELDWSPGVHTQAIGRLHRDGQTDPVLAYFLVAESGSDPVVADVLNIKRQQSDPLLDPDAAPSVVVDTSDRVRRLAAAFLKQH